VAKGQLSMNLATLRNGSSFAQMVDDCLRHGVTAISPWRDQTRRYLGSQRPPASSG